MRHLLAVCLMVSGSVALQASDSTVPATPTTVEWGHYSANAKPAVTIHSGDQTLSTCGPTDRLVARGVKPEDIPAYNDAVYTGVAAGDKGPGDTFLRARSW